MSDTTTVLEPKVIDFFTWCNEESQELPFSQVPQNEEPESDDATSENRKRTGAKESLYPPQYYAGQYPALWKVPSAADSPYYQSINKKK